MNHFESLVSAADTNLFMTRADLPRAEEAVHAFLNENPSLDPKQLDVVLAGDSRANLRDLEAMEICLASSETKHLVKFGALAVLSAIAWQYDPQTAQPNIATRNSSAAMSVLTGFMYSGRNRVADTAYDIGFDISDIQRNSSAEDIQMTLLTYRPTTANAYRESKGAAQIEEDADEIITLDDALHQRVANFPWIDTPIEAIKLDARLEPGLNDIDVLVTDLTPYSSKMQPILADALAHFEESTFRSMERSQIAKVLTGNQSGYVAPPPSSDANLPDVYCAKSFGASNDRLRRLYVSRIGTYQGLAVFARLGFSRTKANQSQLSQILGFYPVKG